jgi:hypothetical protein
MAQPWLNGVGALSFACCPRRYGGGSLSSSSLFAPKREELPHRGTRQSTGIIKHRDQQEALKVL